jgi:DNA polymerase I-like protein with 3'-5' exonuclease and polymerase domains
MIRDYGLFDQIDIDPSLRVFCDTETCEEEGLTSGGLYGQIRLIQIFQESWEQALLIDCFFIDLQDVLSLLHKHHLVFHNGAYDLHTINLKTKSCWVPRELDDTLYLSRMKFYTKQQFGFYNCLEYASHADSLIKGIDKAEEQKSDWSGPLVQKQKLYAACDVVYLCKLFDAVKDMSESTVYRLDIQSLKLAIEYSRNGMPVNRETVKKFKNRSIVELEGILDDLPINPRSSVQSCKYLESSSSNAETLETLIQKGSSRAVKVRDARHHFKSIKFLEGYDRSSIKGFFQPCAAISGRFSCTGGNRFDHHNLQQMPGPLHTIIEAPPGKTIIYKDYSGLELRLAAAYIGEPVM